MRDIKFRGKTENDIWKYGSLLKDNPQKTYYIVDNEEGSGREVLEKTLGQYTGLKDKNGKEIYEGDIIGIEYCDKTIIARVEYSERYAQFIIRSSELLFDNEALSDYDTLRIKIIGNIYDNPDLLEKGAKE